MNERNTATATRRLMLALLPILWLYGCDFSGTFFPVDERPQAAISADHQPVILSSDDGKAIHLVLINPASEVRATVLVFQGSGSTAANWVPLLQPLLQAGYRLFLMDYRGFGRSEGQASHALVLADAHRALRYLVGRDEVRVKPLLVLGQSYGGQLAINVAASYPQLVDALVTEATFTSFRAMAVHTTPWPGKPLVQAIFLEPYDAAELIGAAPMPTLIIHSREDEVVPFHMGQELFNRAAGEKEFWEIDGSHADALVDYPAEFVRRLNTLSGRAGEQRAPHRQ